MRFYEIMLWLLLFNIVVGVLSSQGIYTEYSVQPMNEWSQQVNDSVTNLSASMPQIDTDNWFAAALAQMSLLLQGLLFVTTTFAYATIGVPWMFINMGVPASIAFPFGIAVWFIYGIGIAQLFFGRNIKDME